MKQPKTYILWLSDTRSYKISEICYACDVLIVNYKKKRAGSTIESRNSSGRTQ